MTCSINLMMCFLARLILLSHYINEVMVQKDLKHMKVAIGLQPV